MHVCILDQIKYLKILSMYTLFQDNFVHVCNELWLFLPPNNLFNSLLLHFFLTNQFPRPCLFLSVAPTEFG